jgi:hypothetical protein
MWPIPLVSPGGGRSDPVIIYTGQIDGPFGRATHEVVPLRARPCEIRREGKLNNELLTGRVSGEILLFHGQILASHLGAPKCRLSGRCLVV